MKSFIWVGFTLCVLSFCDFSIHCSADPQNSKQLVPKEP